MYKAKEEKIGAPAERYEQKCHNEQGNILFIIMIAIVLIGLLTVAIQNGNNSDTANIDSEALTIRATEAQRYVSELERAILFITRNEISENDIRFAHPNAHPDYGDLAADTSPNDQVFHQQGGGATYRAPPLGINNGDAWEFYGTTALPNVGSSAADLIVVLPNVTAEFCAHINRINAQNSAQPEDTGTTVATANNAGSCLNGGADARFNSAVQFYTTPNTADISTFTTLPAKQACVQCPGFNGSPYHFYHVIMAR